MCTQYMYMCIHVHVHVHVRMYTHLHTSVVGENEIISIHIAISQHSSKEKLLLHANLQWDTCWYCKCIQKHFLLASVGWASHDHSQLVSSTTFHGYTHRTVCVTILWSILIDKSSIIETHSHQPLRSHLIATCILVYLHWHKRMYIISPAQKTKLTQTAAFPN